MPEPSEDKKDSKSKDEGAQEAEEAKPAIPAGIVPLFFSTASQQLYECVADQDLTEENPHKLISKKKIAEDFKNRAAVCDFHPVKQKVLKYPGDEILLVYDRDFKYGENFYVCITEEAKELVLNPPVEEGQDGGEEGKGEEGEGEEDSEPIPTTPEPKEWVCLGSDREIEEAFVSNSRPLFKFVVSRKRKLFGAPCSFSDDISRDSLESATHIVSQTDSTAYELQTMELERGIQVIPEASDVACQTEWLKPCNAATQYAPRTMTSSEADEIMSDPAMAKFLEKATPRLEVTLQQNEIMNLFEDDYRNLSDRDWITVNKNDANLKEYQSFTDLHFSKDKMVNWIDWHPTIKGIISVACGGIYSFESRIELSSRLILSSHLILLWSFTDPIHPQLFLEAPDDIACFKFNPTHPNIIAGGCINGQVVLWNIQEYQDRIQINKTQESNENRGAAADLAAFETDPKLDHAPIVQHCAVSSIDQGHKMTVCDLHWISPDIEVCTKTSTVIKPTSSGSCVQLLSCSIDGTVMFWDVRQPFQRKSDAAAPKKPTDDNPFDYLDLSWKPFHKILLPRTEYPGGFSASTVSIKSIATGLRASENGTVLNASRPPLHELYQQQGEGLQIEEASTSYIVGTEDGEIVFGDWVLRKDAESGKMQAPRPSHYFNSHCGPVCCLERSPAFQDIVLSVGGWTFCIWKEGITSDALIKSSNSLVPLTGGAWSPTRPGVFFITKVNGNIDVWDLMDKSHEPSLIQNISSLPLTSIRPFPKKGGQSMVAVGDASGTLHVLEVPWNLAHPSTNEESIMETFFQQEVERLKFTTERAAVRARDRKAVEEARAKAEEEPAVEDQDKWEEEAKKDYEQYLALEKTLLTELGVLKDEADNP